MLHIFAWLEYRTPRSIEIRSKLTQAAKPKLHGKLGLVDFFELHKLKVFGVSLLLVGLKDYFLLLQQAVRLIVI